MGHTSSRDWIGIADTISDWLTFVVAKGFEMVLFDREDVGPGFGEADIVAYLTVGIEWEVSCIDSDIVLEEFAYPFIHHTGEGLFVASVESVMDEKEIDLFFDRLIDQIGGRVYRIADLVDLFTTSVDLETIFAAVSSERIVLEVVVEIGNQIAFFHAV